MGAHSEHWPRNVSTYLGLQPTDTNVSSSPSPSVKSKSIEQIRGYLFLEPKMMLCSSMSTSHKLGEKRDKTISTCLEET